MNLYPNLYALLESNSNARRLFDHAPPQVRRQLLVRHTLIWDRTTVKPKM